MSIWKFLKRFIGSRRRKKYFNVLGAPIYLKLIHSAAYEKRKRKKQPYKQDARLQLWNALSRREQDVTALTCLGFTNPQIAARLSLSTETIRTYLENANHKLGVQNKADLRVLFAGWDFGEWERRKDPYR
jgi:DNA-binding CsgD family transcriptional regulator